MSMHSKLSREEEKKDARHCNGDGRECVLVVSKAFETHGKMPLREGG